MTPDEWLPILAKRLDERQPRIALNRQYSTGNAPMPEMGKNTRASWVSFQKKARTDLGGLACRSINGRMIPNGVLIGAAEGPAVLAARRIWRDNRLDVVFADAIWNMLSASVGYLVTGDRDGQPVITSEPPEQVITDPDPVQPWRARAALKAWRDSDEGMDYAYVWVRGVRQKYMRPSKNASGLMHGRVSGGDWAVAGLPEPFAGPVPVHVLDNFNGVAEFEPHTDTIDRINLGKLQRMVTTAMQAFKQRAIKGGLPAQDSDGNDIDWAKALEPAPGALWDLPEGLDVWESAATDIRPLLDGEKQDMRDFASELQIPIDALIPDGQNQSATGAGNAHKGEIQKAKDRIARATVAMAASILHGLRMLGLDDGSTVDIQWEPPEHVSFSEKTAAARDAKAAGLSRRWIARNIMGMSPDEISENETDLAGEMLSQFELTGSTGGDA